MVDKPEFRNVPLNSNMVPARLMGFVSSYAMVRRPGAAPFVITKREWQESFRCTPEGISLNRSENDAG